MRHGHDLAVCSFIRKGMFIAITELEVMWIACAQPNRDLLKASQEHTVMHEDGMPPSLSADLDTAQDNGQSQKVCPICPQTLTHIKLSLERHRSNCRAAFISQTPSEMHQIVSDW